MTRKQTQKTAAPIDNSKHITDCSFIGVKWDAQAVSAIQTVADGLVKNAEGLKALAEVFKSQNIQMAPMIYVGEDLKAQKENT